MEPYEAVFREQPPFQTAGRCCALPPSRLAKYQSTSRIEGARGGAGRSVATSLGRWWEPHGDERHLAARGARTHPTPAYAA